MKTIIRKRWIGPEAYVEVSYRPRLDKLDVRSFTRDPRKAQHRKVKFWNRGLWIPFQTVDIVIGMFASGALGRDVVIKTAQAIIEEDLCLTSSEGRALAS